MWVAQFASVSSCTRTSPLEALQLHTLFYDADNGWLRNAYHHNISQTVLWVRGWSCWLRTVSFTWSKKWSVFLSVQACRYAAALTSVHCAVSLNFFSSLLMLLFVLPLCWNSVLNCVALYPFSWYNNVTSDCQ